MNFNWLPFFKSKSNDITAPPPPLPIQRNVTVHELAEVLTNAAEKLGDSDLPIAFFGLTSADYGYGPYGKRLTIHLKEVDMSDPPISRSVSSAIVLDVETLKPLDQLAASIHKEEKVEL